MTSGGARNRSGPKIAGDSELTLSFTALPAEGYQGEIPAFPLPEASDRELELWATAWRTPQACAWAAQPWRIYGVAQWVRWSITAEAPGTPAASVTAAIRLADQIGMTPAGLKENGWKIAENEVAAKAVSRAPRKSSRERMTVVRDGTEG